MSGGIGLEADREVTVTAVLRCGPITKEYLQSGITGLKAWGKENARFIMEKEPLTREYGFFIVTATRKTDHCDILCTTKRTRSIAPEVSAGSPYVGDVQADGHFIQDDKLNPGWIRRPVENLAVYIHLVVLTHE